MKREWVQYWPTQRGVMLDEVKARLPAELRSHLLAEGPYSYGIGVDASDAVTIAGLDAHFRIGSRLDYIKHRDLEVDNSHIDEYEHFWISPTSLEVSAAFAGNIVAASADEFLESLRIRRKLRGGPHLYELGTMVPGRVFLLLDATLHELFEAYGVRGLRYGAALAVPGSNPPVEGDITTAYGAAIDVYTQYVGDAIIPNEEFRGQPRMLIGPYVFGQRIQRADLKDVDFQACDRIQVGKELYFRSRAPWMVSRRVLKLLLEHGVRGLTTTTTLLKAEFRPVLLDEPGAWF